MLKCNEKLDSSNDDRMAVNWFVWHTYTETENGHNLVGSVSSHAWLYHVAIISHSYSATYNKIGIYCRSRYGLYAFLGLTTRFTPLHFPWESKIQIQPCLWSILQFALANTCTIVQGPFVPLWQVNILCSWWIFFFETWPFFRLFPWAKTREIWHTMGAKRNNFTASAPLNRK